MMTIAKATHELSLLSNPELHLFAFSTPLDFDVELNTLAPMTVTLQNSDYHTIDINIGKPCSMSVASTGSKRIVCQQGNILALVPAGEQVTLGWSAELNSIRVNLSRQFVDRVLGEENVSFLSGFDIADSLLYDLCMKLKEQKWNHENISGIYAEGIAIAIIIHLYCNYSAGGRKIFAPKGRLSATHLNSIFDYTLAHIGKNIRLSEMAETIHMSEFHFARLFKLTLGISPYRFVLQMKIDQAKKLIKNEKKSCSDIAYILNFSDQAHFSHVFKKITGLSPRTFMNAVA